jgi:hypothetical protein
MGQGYRGYMQKAIWDNGFVLEVKDDKGLLIIVIVFKYYMGYKD